MSRTDHDYARATRAVVVSEGLCLLLNDVLLHRSKHTEKGLLICRGYLEFVQRADQVLDQSIEISFRDAHALVRRLHVLARILARTAAGLADLVH